MTKKEKEKPTDPLQLLREEIVRVAKISHDKNFSAGIGSNYSIRTGKEEMIVTPTGINKAWMNPEDMIQVKFNGEVISGTHEVSSEFPMHVWIYRALPDAGAIIHSNPPYLTAFAVAGQGLETAHLTEPYLQIGDYIPLVHYATPSTEDLATMFKPYLRPQRKIYLMQNHGVVVVGKDMTEAYNAMAMGENYAHVMSLFGLPAPKIIDNADLKLLNDTFKNS
jgi:L-fuculose-phosphate aldolase